MKIITKQLWRLVFTVGFAAYFVMAVVWRNDVEEQLGWIVEGVLSLVSFAIMGLCGIVVILFMERVTDHHSRSHPVEELLKAAAYGGFVGILVGGICTYGSGTNRIVVAGYAIALLALWYYGSYCIKSGYVCSRHNEKNDAH